MTELNGASFALAILGIIDVIVRGGEVVYRKVEVFRRQHEFLNRYAQNRSKFD
jgi:hypothetical protein